LTTRGLVSTFATITLFRNHITWHSLSPYQRLKILNAGPFKREGRRISSGTFPHFKHKAEIKDAGSNVNDFQFLTC